jgi:hemoglobin
MIKTLTLCALTISLTAFGAEPAKTAATPAAAINTTCPIKGNAVNPKCIYAYEGRTYAFCTGECRKEFIAKVEGSIYHQIGGQAAIDAAVESFYKKVLADDRIKHFFDDVNMNAQRRKQKAFLSAAFGSPVKWEGKDMRTAHAGLTGLNETNFNAVAENLKTTLEELKVKKELIDQIMTIAASTKDDVLNRKPAAK